MTNNQIDDILTQARDNGVGTGFNADSFIMFQSAGFENIEAFYKAAFKAGMEAASKLCTENDLVKSHVIHSWANTQSYHPVSGAIVQAAQIISKAIKDSAAKTTAGEQHG